MGKNELNVWLNYLKETMSFELVASMVFDRLIDGDGAGLMIIQGPSKLANKTFFLKMVSAFQSGVPAEAREYFSNDLYRKLDELSATRYQCIDIKEECGIQPDAVLFRTPLSIVLPLSLAKATIKRGMRKGHKLVLLCDDLNQFFYRDAEPNIPYLKTFADSLEGKKDITFLGAYTVETPGEWTSHAGIDLKQTPLGNYSLQLGYD